MTNENLQKAKAIEGKLFALKEAAERLLNAEKIGIAEIVFYTDGGTYPVTIDKDFIDLLPLIETIKNKIGWEIETLFNELEKI